MSIQALKYVLEVSPIYGAPRIVLVALAYHAGPTGECWPGLDTIAFECRTRKAEVVRAVKTLQTAQEIELLSAGNSRKSTRYRLSGFLRWANVGGPTSQIPDGYPIGNRPQTAVPEAISGVDTVPPEFRGNNKLFPVIHREQQAVPSTSPEQRNGQNGGVREQLAVPPRRDTVPTEFSGNENLENRQGSVPAGSGNANRQRQTPSVAASAPAPWGDGRDGEYFKEWFRLLNEGKTPEEARAVLQSRAAGNGNGKGSVAPIRHYARAAEILAHVKRAAAGEEPFDFVDPKPAPSSDQK